MKHFLVFVLITICAASVSGIDFGVSKLTGTFSSGVAQAAKVPGSAISAIASIPGKVVGGGSSEPTTGASTPTTSPTSSFPNNDTYTPPSTATSGDLENIPTTTIPSSSAISISTQDVATSPSSLQNYTKTDKVEGDSTPSSSWIPGTFKRPLDAVISVPKTVADTAVDTVVDTWDTVSETIVNNDPAHGVKFYLYDDSNNLTNYKQVVIDQPDTLRDVRVAPNSRLSILIHGFMQDHNSSFPQQMKDALLQYIGGPVVCVDWGHMADGKFGPGALRTLFYPFIVGNVATVGEYVGEFVVFLMKNRVISSYDQIHIIGFSLGGHVSGIAGHTVQNRTEGEKVGRITGLDPAGPKFFLKTKERKLNQDDASFVDVIHTSHLGYFLSLGHLDFFPNGGKIQPGCVETEESITDAVASLGTVLTGSCSHARAWEYYTRSIRDNDLYGCECNNLFKYELTGCEVECEDKVPFGEPAPSSARGTYFLTI